VVKIHGQAPSCSRALEGSGFVIAPQRVLTNAHVVAGTEQVSVLVKDGQLDAHVVYYNSDIDVAILAVPDLTAPPLPLRPGRGTDRPGLDRAGLPAGRRLHRVRGPGQQPVHPARPEHLRQPDGEPGRLYRVTPWYAAATPVVH